MFKIFVHSTFHVTHQQAIVFIVGAGGGLDNNYVFQKLQWQELIVHNNFQCKISGFCCDVVEDFTLLGLLMYSLGVGY